MVDSFVAELDLRDESKSRSVLGHVTILTSYNATQNNWVVVTIVRSIKFLKNLRMSPQDRKPKSGAARVHRCTSIKKGADDCTAFEWRVQFPENKGNVWQLAINLDRKEGFAVAIGADKDGWQVGHNAVVTGTCRGVSRQG
jgi:hypothetical protein